MPSISSRTPSALTCTGLSFAWPDGSAVLDGLDLAVSPGRTASPAATAREVDAAAPARRRTRPVGRQRPRGREIGYLPCRTPPSTPRVARGRGPRRRGRPGRPARHRAGRRTRGALRRGRRRLGRGGAGTRRARPTRPRPPGTRPDGRRDVGRRVRAAAPRRTPAGPARDPAAGRADEQPRPEARRRLYAAVDSWPGALVAVSHDRSCWSAWTASPSCAKAGSSGTGGPYSVYEEIVAAAQEAAERTVRTAEADVRRQRRELAEAQQSCPSASATGRRELRQQHRPADRRAGAQARRPGVGGQAPHPAGAAAHGGPGAAGRGGGGGAGRRRDPRRAAPHRRTAGPRGAAAARPDAPARRAPGGRDGGARTGAHRPRGPERRGQVDTAADDRREVEPVAGQAAVRCAAPLPAPAPGRAGRRGDGGGERARFAPEATPNRVGARLARFRSAARRRTSGPGRCRAGSASGGARGPAAGGAAPQLLLLDEPTNSLDLASVRSLDGGAGGVRALIVASHDESRSWNRSGSLGD